MRIVDLKTFLSLPTGTVFSHYRPCILNDLCIKAGNCGEIDFFVHDLVAPWPDSHSSEEAIDILTKSEETGNEFPVDHEYRGRDGCFNTEQLFAIWSPDDVRGLIKNLQSTLDGTYK